MTDTVLRYQKCFLLERWNVGTEKSPSEIIKKFFPIGVYKSMGLWYYSKLPPGMRAATLEDFLLPSGAIKLGTDYLVYSDIVFNYEAHRMVDEDRYYRISDYIKADKIFIRPQLS